MTHNATTIGKTDLSKQVGFWFLAGVEGFEPSQTVLETGVLPLTPYPYVIVYYKFNNKMSNKK